jgi:hypothetical protein
MASSRKPDGLLEHRLAQIVVKLGKRSRSTEVDRFEAAEIEPVAAEFGGQPAHAVVFQHAARLRQQHVGPLQIARRGVRQQFLVGHAGPQEITQPAGQFVPAERADRAGSRSGAAQIEAVAEIGRHQDADDRIANGVFVRQPFFLAELVVIRRMSSLSAFESGRR